MGLSLPIYHFTHQDATSLCLASLKLPTGQQREEKFFATYLLCLNVAERAIRSKKMLEKKISRLKVPNFSCV
jgi:hypothetical protein